MSIKKNFGKRVRELRLQSGLTQEELAEKIGISPKSLSQIELGGNFVSADTLELICSTLNISPDILFNFNKIDATKEDLVEEIVDTIKDKPELIKAIYKITLALSS
ncbi:MAG: helix-turn-helix transcriptional regulator [bacterium]|nr:helix-turn-helix transcriptional regulator [bacterium]